MEIAQAIDDFQTYCRVRRQLSPRTTKNYYGYPLRSVFLPWCESRGIATVEALEPKVLDAFTLALEERITPKGDPIKPATRLAYLKALRHFLAWAKEHGSEVVPERVGLPRLRRQHKDVLSDQEMQELEDAARTERDKLLIRLMVETGMRIGEVVSMRVDDLVERERRYYFARIRGKTGERMPPISTPLYRRLRAYAAGKTGRPKTRDTHLFMAERRRAHGDYEPLTTTGIYRAIRDAADRAELDRSRVHPHLLRASAITRMCAAGMHPALVSTICGVSVGVIAMHYSFPTQAQQWEAAQKALEALGRR